MKRTSLDRTDYVYEAGTATADHAVLLPALLDALKAAGARRVLDLGCGNGSLTKRVIASGYEVVGTEMSESGLDFARANNPGVEFFQQDISDPLPPEWHGVFDTVLCAEVIEHLLLPREVFHRAREATGGKGQLIVTTPYHGYLKNLAIAATGKFDKHYMVHIDYGHIKFFSVPTLTAMTRECGWEPLRWGYAGRIKPLAMSMLMTARPTAPAGQTPMPDKK